MHPYPGICPDGFVDIQDVIPNVCLDIRYATDNNFVGRPIMAYHAQRAFLTKQTATALQSIQAILEKIQLSLLIYDAYRPVQAVNDFMDWINSDEQPGDNFAKDTYYPYMEKKDIVRLGYLSKHSAHSRGSTVDLTICSLKNMPNTLPSSLDMGGDFDFFGEISHPNYLNITFQQRANRLLLATLMENHNFVQASNEWWHFTLQNEPYPNTYFDFPIC